MPTTNDLPTRPAPADDTNPVLAATAAALAALPYARRGVATSGDPIRVVLADDHKLLRQGVKALLRNAPDIIVIGEASSGDEAVTVALRLRPDVVVMDLDMEGGDGASATRSLARDAPSIRVLILTMHTEEERLIPLLERGASGFLSKDAARNEFLEAIRVVASGDAFVRPTAARLLAENARPHTHDRAPLDEAREKLALLSKREQSVLRRVAEG